MFVTVFINLSMLVNKNSCLLFVHSGLTNFDFNDALLNVEININYD